MQLKYYHTVQTIEILDMLLCLKHEVVIPNLQIQKQYFQMK